MAIFLVIVLVTALKISQPFTLIQIKELVVSFDYWSPLVYIVITALTNIIPPLAATPLWLAGAYVFGFPWAYVYIFIANILGSTINYVIARVLGRPVVKFMAGEKGLVEIDRFIGVKDLRTIFLLRLVGGAASDYISYGAGLSSIRLGPYLITTILGTAPIMLLGFWFINDAVSQHLARAAGILGAYFVISYLLSLLMIPIFAYNSKHRAVKS